LFVANVVVVGQVAERTDHGVRPNRQRFGGIQHGVAIEVAALAERNDRFGRRRGTVSIADQESDPTVQRDAVSEPDAFRVARDLHRSQPGCSVKLDTTCGEDKSPPAGGETMGKTT